MGFYGKAFDNGLQAKAACSKPILFPANQNLGRSGLYLAWLSDDLGRLRIRLDYIGLRSECL